MRVFIVHAHPEPQSFNSAMTREATHALVRNAASTRAIRRANAVEQAAFGGTIVDGRAQAQVDELVPGEPPVARGAHPRAR